jgi:AbiTii
VTRTVPCVNHRSHRLIQEIEAGALDRNTPIGDLLRKIIALGGQAGSTELRDWATKELRGYGPDDELPPYRTIGAPLQLDMVNAAYIMRAQTISPLELPKEAHGKITNDVHLRMGIAEIEQYARQCPPGDVVKFTPPGGQELIVIMNAEMDLNGQVQRLYWGVSPVSLDGVVEQVRTTLTVMIAEIRANVSDDTEVPPAEVATNAINFAVSGKRNKVNFAAPQGGSKMPTQPAPEESPRRWVRIVGVVIASILGILLAFAGALFALMQAQGWRF